VGCGAAAQWLCRCGVWICDSSVWLETVYFCYALLFSHVFLYILGKLGISEPEPKIAGTRNYGSRVLKAVIGYQFLLPELTKTRTT
jgi:hypothetical protein